MQYVVGVASPHFCIVCSKVSVVDVSCIGIAFIVEVNAMIGLDEYVQEASRHRNYDKPFICYTRLKFCQLSFSLSRQRVQAWACGSPCRPLFVME